MIQQKSIFSRKITMTDMMLQSCNPQILVTSSFVCYFGFVILLSSRLDLIISMEVLRLGGICLSSCLIITISMWQFHEWRKLRDLHHLPLSQDHPLLYQRKCDFWIKDWHRPLHWPRVVIKAPDRSLHQDRIEGQVLSLCNANCSLYPCKNVYIADSVTRESREVVKCGANMLF